MKQSEKPLTAAASFCSSCGKELDKSTAYCKHCGAKIQEGKAEKKSGPGKVILIAALSVVLVALVATAVFLTVQNNKSAPPPVPQEIVKGTISVPAGKSVSYPFTLNNPAIVTGTFKASGGGGNDIVVLVISADAYTNWINGHQVDVLYNSGQETLGKVLALISSPGEYDLVFDNSFSTFTSKSVVVDVSAASQ